MLIFHLLLYARDLLPHSHVKEFFLLDILISHVYIHNRTMLTDIAHQNKVV